MVVFESLHGKDQCSVSKNAIDGIDHGHESGLLVVSFEIDIAEEIGLHQVERSNLAQYDSCFVVPVAWTIDRPQTCSGLLEQVWRI